MGHAELDQSLGSEPSRCRRLSSIALVAAGAVLVSSIVFSLIRVSRTQAALVEAEQAKLTALADTRTAEVELLIDSYRQKADLVASRTRLRNLLAGYRQAPDPAAVEEMSRIVRDAAESDELIASIAVVDLDGNVVAASDDTLIVASGRDRLSAREAAPNPDGPNGRHGPREARPAFQLRPAAMTLSSWSTTEDGPITG